MSNKPNLSIVIPVYNEENRIEKGLSKIFNYLDKQKYSWEIILVDDGSFDSTVDLTKHLLKDRKNGRLLKSKHLGKGGAIKKGVLNAQGKWLIFMDIDLATPIEELEKFWKLKEKYDILIGSRKMKGAKVIVHQPKFREFGGKVFTFLTNLLVTKNISDVTCGFKFYKTEVAKKLFTLSKLYDWSFDAEILFLARKGEFSVKEIPVEWRDDPHTKVNLFRDTIDAFIGLLKIRFFDIIGHYHS